MSDSVCESLGFVRVLFLEFVAGVACLLCVCFFGADVCAVCAVSVVVVVCVSFVSFCRRCWCLVCVVVYHSVAVVGWLG